MATFQVPPPVLISRPDPPPNTPADWGPDGKIDKITPLSQLSFDFLDATSPILSPERSWSSLSFTRGPPSELDLASSLILQPKRKEELTALPLFESANKVSHDSARPKPKYEPEDPCLPKPGSINDIAYFLRNTGPSDAAESFDDRRQTIESDRDSMSERTSTRGSLIRSKLGFSIFRRKKKKEPDPRTSLQESRLSSSSLSSSCVPKVSMQGKRYIQIVTSQDDVRTGDVPNPLRTHPTLQTVLEGGQTIHPALRQESRMSNHAEGGLCGISGNVPSYLTPLSQTSINETPSLEPVDIFEPIPTYPMLASLSRLNSADSSGGASMPSQPSSAQRKTFFGLMTSPLRRSIDVDRDLPAPPRLRDLNSSQAYGQSGAQSCSSSLYSVPSEPRDISDPVPVKSRAPPIAFNRTQRTHDRKVKQLKSGLSRSHIPDSTDDTSAGETIPASRPGTLSRQSTGTRMSLDEMLKQPIEKPSVKWASSVNEKHENIDRRAPASPKPHVLKKSTKFIRNEPQKSEDDARVYLDDTLAHPTAYRPAVVLTPATTPPSKHSPTSSRSSLTIKTADIPRSTSPIPPSYKPFPAPPRSSSRNSSVEKLDMDRKPKKKKKRSGSSTSTSARSSFSVARSYAGLGSDISLIEEDNTTIRERHASTEAEAQLLSRLDALERKNILLEAAIVAMLDASNTSLQKRICPLDELLLLEDKSPRPSLDINWTSETSKPAYNHRTSATRRNVGSSTKREVLPEGAVAAAVRAAADDFPSDLTAISPEVSHGDGRSIRHASLRRDSLQSGTAESSWSQHAREDSAITNGSSRTKAATAVEFRFSKSVERLERA